MREPNFWYKEGTRALFLISNRLKANPNMRLEIAGHNNEEEDTVGEEKPKYASMDSKRVSAVMQSASKYYCFFMSSSFFVRGRLMFLVDI